MSESDILPAPIIELATPTRTKWEREYQAFRRPPDAHTGQRALPACAVVRTAISRASRVPDGLTLRPSGPIIRRTRNAPRPSVGRSARFACLLGSMTD